MHVELEVSNKRSNVKRLLIREAALVGRQRHCDIRIASNELSREHCRIEIQQNQAILVDLESTNGTFLNGNRIEPQQAYPLNEGDLIQIGPAAFQVRLCIEPLKKLHHMDTLPPASEETFSAVAAGEQEEPIVLSGEDEEETLPSESLEAPQSQDEIEVMQADEEEAQDESHLAGVTSDAEISVISDEGEEDDAYDRFLKDL